MKFSLASAAALLMTGTVMAAPCGNKDTAESAGLAQKIATISPKSTSCDGADYPGQCRTNVQAAPHISKSFTDYEIKTDAEKAGIIALMAFESVDFHYKHNISPGRPGQGTANMQMIQWNEKYVASIPELKDQAAGKDDNGVLALVTPDKYNFGSGAWFYKTQCASKVGSTDDAEAFFTSYMSCVGVTIDDGRRAYWNQAKTAFGL